MQLRGGLAGSDGLSQCRPTSPKTKKREAEIAEIKRKREMRLQMQKEQAEMVGGCLLGS